jgi:hypothetical protein
MMVVEMRGPKKDKFLFKRFGLVDSNVDPVKRASLETCDRIIKGFIWGRSFYLPIASMSQRL